MTRRVLVDGVLVEEWDDGARLYRRWDGTEIVEQRPYNDQEAAVLVAADHVAAVEANRTTIAATALLALQANAADVTQDAVVESQAQTIIDSPATSLTQAQLIALLKQLAQGVAVLASHDATSKRELTSLVRLAVGALDSTDGT